MSCANWSNLPKSWFSVETNSEAVSFSESGVKFTMSAYKMLSGHKSFYLSLVVDSHFT